MKDIVEMMRNLLSNREAQAAWKEDPEAYLEKEGASDLSVSQINEAAQVAFSPTDLGASVNVEGNQTVGDTNFGDGLDKGLRGMDTGGGGGGTQAPAPQTAPPVPPAPHASMSPAQQIEETINYYVTNVTETNVDDRDTFVDNSVDVINVGGTVDIDQDTTIASGDGAVAAGGNNTGVNTGEGGVAVGGSSDGPIVTGDDNIVVDGSGPVTIGDGNIVGDDNTVGDDNIDVDNSGEGDVIVGDKNENNDLDLDIDGSNGPINVGVGSGNTNQDNSTEDNDFIDDKDLLDLDVDNSTQDNDFIDDKDGLDLDANFGGGRSAADAPREVKTEAPDEEALLRAREAALAKEAAPADQVEIVAVAAVVEDPIVVEEFAADPEPAPEEMTDLAD